jgi:hypothetical protein
MFDCLQIIEFQISANAPSSSVHLKAIRDLTDAFCPETCSRQVIIFFAVSNVEKFTKHFEEISKLAHTSIHKYGLEAYRFLLSWVVGGEYRATKPGYKIAMFNDNHILGRFKERWNNFQEQMKLSSEHAKTSQSKDLKKEEKYQRLMSLYIRLIDVLLTDAHQIRKKIENGSYGETEILRTTLNVAIDNIILSRVHEVPVVYEAMHEVGYPSILLKFLEAEVKKLTIQLENHPKESAASNRITIRINLYSQAVHALKAEPYIAIRNYGAGVVVSVGDSV